MTKKMLRLSIILSLIFAGCTIFQKTTVWTAEPAAPIYYNKIMIVGILEQRNDSLRAAMENQMVTRLASIGYYASSSIKEFGPNGLRPLSEEATYLTLCDNGIDAVMTIAWVKDSQTVTLDNGLDKKYTSAFYYNRIWDYKKLQEQPIPEKGPYSCEAILFDLSRLEPQCVIGLKKLSRNRDNINITRITDQLTKRMVKEKVLVIRDTAVKVLRPF